MGNIRKARTERASFRTANGEAKKEVARLMVHEMDEVYKEMETPEENELSLE